MTCIGFQSGAALELAALNFDCAVWASAANRLSLPFVTNEGSSVLRYSLLVNEHFKAEIELPSYSHQRIA